MKVIVKIFMLVPVMYLLVMPVYYTLSGSSVICSDIDVNIVDSSDNHFITKKSLLNMVYVRDGEILGRPVNRLAVGDIETRMNVIRELKTGEAYTTIDGTLHLYADQRDPVMRIIPDEGGDYFLDEEGFIFRKRNLQNPRLHIVGGNIRITPRMLENVSIFDTSVKNTILRDVYYFVKYIRRDDFWSAQIDQIYIDSRNEVSLIPRAGSHIIYLGTFENYEGKLRNLAAFYDKVLPEVGWNKYSSINLEYRDQVVCKRRN